MLIKTPSTVSVRCNPTMSSLLKNTLLILKSNKHKVQLHSTVPELSRNVFVPVLEDEDRGLVDLDSQVFGDSVLVSRCVVNVGLLARRDAAVDL